MRLAGAKAIRRMRRVLKFWQGGALAAVAAALAGCETGSRPPPTLVPARKSAPAPVAKVPEPVVVAPAAPLVVTSAVPAVVVSNPPPVLARPAWPSNWANAWIPLESWGQFNGLEKPRQLSGGLEAAYQLPTSNGAMLVRMGSHTLRFGGLDFWLGFAPKLIKGLPYIHAVDARKTLQPLLGPANWTMQFQTWSLKSCHTSIRTCATNGLNQSTCIRPTRLAIRSGWGLQKGICQFLTTY